MAVGESNPKQTAGKLVALEGDTESISVQLKLLPPSRKILVLPPLGKSSFVGPSDAFDARVFIRAIHTAFTERTETARSFLQSSTSIHPRLVFLNGGNISARATCIEKISENITNGEVAAAETIFNEIVKGGVVALMKHDKSSDKEEHDLAVVVDAGDDGEISHPTSETMINANSSNVKDELIQSSNNTQDAPQLQNEDSANNYASTIAQRSGSDPGIQQNWRSGSIKQPTKVPTSILTAQEGDQIVHTVLEFPIRTRRLPLQDPRVVHEKRSTFGPPESLHRSSMQFHNALIHQPEGSEDKGGHDGASLTSAEDDTMSMPTTPAFVFGEACLVDVQSASPLRSIGRARSFDRFFPSASKSQGSFLAPPQLKHTTSAYHLRGRNPSPGGEREKRYSKFPTLPRSTFVRASETTIKKYPTQTKSMRSDSSSSEPLLPLPKTYVDRATDAGETVEDIKMQPFSPVFPVTEDIIIHLIDDSPNKILESVIQSFKNGNYAINPSSQASLAMIPDSPTSEYFSPDPQSFDGKHTIRPSSYQAMLPRDDSYVMGNEGSNTISSHYSIGFSKPWSAANQYPGVNTPLEPPTPIQTPPLVPSIADKIIDLAPISSSNVISIQNSLRQLLAVHFPPGESGHSQHYYPVAPEAERLWKPVFRNDENSSIGNEGRTVDHIIALGCEAGVNQEYFYQISGQIERFGMKKDGVNRSGKLDIRYLIGNAMQTYFTLPLIYQPTFNPLSNAETLAALVVPQLEAYLAANSNTQLLILQYQVTHLPVIFALRRILGTDLLKIAGILDSLSSDPPSFASLRAPSSPLSNESVAERWRDHARHARLHSVQRSRRAPDLDLQNKSDAKSSPEPIVASFSRANYLLSSTATDAEITNFLSSIWKCLMERSAFYTPELEVKQIKFNERVPPTPRSTTHSSYELPPRDSSYPPSMQRSAPSKMSRMTGTSGSNMNNNSNSDARSTRHRSPSCASTRRAHHESIAVPLPVLKISPPNTSERQATLSDAEKADKENDRSWENFYIGEDDSDDDEFDRMIMGRHMARILPEVRKVSEDDPSAVPRNKKKALKWLGLA